MGFFKEWFGGSNDEETLVNKGPAETVEQTEDYMKDVTGNEMGVVSKDEIEAAKNNLN